jgi:hypothetical protein
MAIKLDDFILDSLQWNSYESMERSNHLTTCHHSAPSTSC